VLKPLYQLTLADCSFGGCDLFYRNPNKSDVRRKLFFSAMMLLILVHGGRSTVRAVQSAQPVVDSLELLPPLFLVSVLRTCEALPAVYPSHPVAELADGDMSQHCLHLH